MFIDDWTLQHKNRGWKNCNTIRTKFKGGFQGKKGECLLLPKHVKNLWRQLEYLHFK